MRNVSKADVSTKKTFELNIEFSYDCTNWNLGYIIDLICLKFDISHIRIPLNLYIKLVDTQYINGDGLFVTSEYRCINIYTCFQKSWNYGCIVYNNTLSIIEKDVRNG